MQKFFIIISLQNRWSSSSCFPCFYVCCKNAFCTTFLIYFARTILLAMTKNRHNLLTLCDNIIISTFHLKRVKSSRLLSSSLIIVVIFEIQSLKCNIYLMCLKSYLKFSKLKISLYFKINSKLILNFV